jgi:hypothetical protein
MRGLSAKPLTTPPGSSPARRLSRATAPRVIGGSAPADPSTPSRAPAQRALGVGHSLSPPPDPIGSLGGTGSPQAVHTCACAAPTASLSDSPTVPSGFDRGSHMIL